MKKNWQPVLVVVVLLLIVVAATVIGRIADKYTPTKEKANLYKEYEVEEDSNMAAIILQDTRSDKKALVEDGVIYLEFNMIKDTFNHRFYFDTQEELLLYTTPDSLIRCEAGKKEYKVNKKKQKTDYEIVKLITQDTITTTYVALDFVKQFTALEYEFYQEPARVCITYQWGNVTTCSAKEETAVRVDANIKSPVMVNAEESAKLRVIEKKDKWTKVISEDGLIGYVQNKYLGKEEEETLKTDFEEPVYDSIKKDKKINMVWHQMENVSANDNMAGMITDTDGITVLSPTWFRLSDNKGNISDIGSASYVKLAHKLGYEVWALVDDQAAESDDAIVLAKTTSRQKIVKNLMNAVEEYNLDGINVDLEYIKKENAEDYLQFLRELSIECRKSDVVLSIDNYIPKEYNLHYDRTEQGILADYIVVMCYDEHHSQSEEAGSVASLPFVREGIENTLKEVPAEKVIMAVPFFTRVWKETPEEYADSNSQIYENKGNRYSLSSRALGMDGADEEIESNHAEKAWNEELGQYFASWEKDNSTYMVWLEETRSLEEKLKLISEHNLAGVSGWRLGLENSKVWDIMKKYLE